ncbi:hypothetical protein QT711_04565 [Sporosarcina saromensis]|uniref:Uncharacterized protein n=1 Tax=Sporosarcina saromensis TaxID=359365 RepID=A0ABU4GA45_9BACL|nr:hypothetical protein [Sporosarcina saromensis]MDW0112447.1 hypothetical protein [Sporosarcina saromensis]
MKKKLTMFILSLSILACTPLVTSAHGYTVTGISGPEVGHPIVVD